MNGGGTRGLRVLATTISTEQDVFALRRHGRLAAQALGLDAQDQVRLATALSELGRDRLGCVAATADFTLVPGAPPALVVTLRWKQGPAPSREALESASRLLPRIVYQADNPSPGITVVQPLPAHADQLPNLAARVRDVLTAHTEPSREDDLRAQTGDLIEALVETRAQRDELHRLNEELEETNAGVMALYAELSQELEQTNSGVVALHGELEDRSRQLRAASEAKTRFWANVSHELRTPVNSVIGLSRLLLSEPPAALDAEQRQQLGLIAASGNTMLALVDELMDVAKAESGQLVPQPAPVDLRALLAQLHGSMRAAASQYGTSLLIPHQPSPSEIVTDEVMLTRVLRNLLSNSLKFTEGGEVRVELRAHADAQPGEPDRWLDFEISDTGVGIPQDEQERIFEEFYQVRGPHQRGRTGTGLGLPYARRLTELLGGTLTLTSEPGQGTRVTVRLPLGSPPEAVGAASARLNPRLVTLISVDDDPEFSAAFRPLLERLAERVIQIDSTDPFLDTVRHERPELILLDLHMPDVDGYDLIGLLAADAELRTIPVVVVTSAPSRLVDRSRLAHARAVVEKKDLTEGVLAAAIGSVRDEGEEGARP